MKIDELWNILFLLFTLNLRQTGSK